MYCLIYKVSCYHVRSDIHTTMLPCTVFLYKILCYHDLSDIQILRYHDCLIYIIPCHPMLLCIVWNTQFHVFIYCLNTHYHVTLYFLMYCLMYTIPYYMVLSDVHITKLPCIVIYTQYHVGHQILRPDCRLRTLSVIYCVYISYYHNAIIWLFMWIKELVWYLIVKCFYILIVIHYSVLTNS